MTTKLAHVGEAEKIARIVPETILPLLKRQAPEQNKRAVVSFAPSWSIAKLRSLYALQCHFSLSFLNDTLVLVSSQPLVFLCGHMTLLTSPRHAPALTIKALCNFGRPRYHVLTQRINDTIFLPVSNLCCDGKAHIASQTDPKKTLKAHRDPVANPLQCTVIGDVVSRMFCQVQPLHAVNKMDNNRIVEVLAITRKHHFLFAFGLLRSICSCHANNSFSGCFAEKGGKVLVAN